jgi:hypothetical protein
MISRLRLVATTAFLAGSSSQTFILLRSIAFTDGRVSCNCRKQRTAVGSRRGCRCDDWNFKRAVGARQCYGIIQHDLPGYGLHAEPGPRLKIDKQHHAFFWFQEYVYRSQSESFLEFVTGPERPIIQVAPWLGLLQELSREKNSVVGLKPKMTSRLPAHLDSRSVAHKSCVTISRRPD